MKYKQRSTAVDRFWEYYQKHLCSLKPQSSLEFLKSIIYFSFLFLASDSGAHLRKAQKYTVQKYKKIHTKQFNIYNNR